MRGRGARAGLDGVGEECIWSVGSVCARVHARVDSLLSLWRVRRLTKYKRKAYCKARNLTISSEPPRLPELQATVVAQGQARVSVFGAVGGMHGLSFSAASPTVVYTVLTLSMCAAKSMP